LFGEFGELLGFPAGAALLQDAFEQLRAGFRWRVLGAPFGGERAFHGGFQQRLAVLRQLLLRGLEFGHAGIEVGEQFFEFGDDAGLFGSGNGATHQLSLDRCFIVTRAW
jgi:hypothetical protein